MKPPYLGRLHDPASIIDLALDLVGITLLLFGRIAWGWNTRYYFLLFLAETALLLLFEQAKVLRAELPPRTRPGEAPRTREQALEGSDLVWFLLIVSGFFTTMVTVNPAFRKGEAHNPLFDLPPFDPIVYVLPFALIALSQLHGYWRFLSTKEYQRVSPDDVDQWAGLRVFAYTFLFMTPCAIFSGPWYSISIIPIALFILLRAGFRIIEFLSPPHAGSGTTARVEP